MWPSSYSWPVSHPNGIRENFDIDFNPYYRIMQGMQKIVYLKVL